MKTDSMASKAFIEIRRKILINQLLPNTRLKEEQWAEKLKVSRMAVREALTRLLGEGLVILGPKGGYYIRPMNAEDVHQIRELREILELGAVRLAHKRFSKEYSEKLEQICDSFTDMVKQGFYNGACEADMKFHETLIESSGNQKLLDAYHASHIPLFHQKLGRTREYMNDYELTDIEHRAILKALKSKNLSLAEKTLIKHFLRGENAILDLD